MYLKKAELKRTQFLGHHLAEKAQKEKQYDTGHPNSSSEKSESSFLLCV